MMSLRECFTMARKTYHSHYPYAFFEYGHYCYLRLRPKRGKEKILQDEYHRIDRYTGKISGVLRDEDILGNPALRSSLETEFPVSAYERKRPARFGRKGILDCLDRGVRFIRSLSGNETTGQ